MRAAPRDPITRMFSPQSTLIRRLALTGAITIGWSVAGPALPAEPADTNAGGHPASVGNATAQPAEQANAAAIARAIEAGTVLTGMKQEQVLAARGEPIRRETIPPDAELWHYPEGEVAFSGGKVSYVDLRAPQPAAQSPSQSPSKPASLQPAPPASTAQPANTATVNTPGDGFLALRSEPSVRRGRRLFKIPHGTMLTLDECRTWPGDGRWCRTRFRGQTGWVFERYLVR